MRFLLFLMILLFFPLTSFEVAAFEFRESGPESEYWEKEVITTNRQEDIESAYFREIQMADDSLAVTMQSLRDEMHRMETEIDSLRNMMIHTDSSLRNDFDENRKGNANIFLILFGIIILLSIYFIFQNYRIERMISGTGHPPGEIQMRRAGITIPGMFKSLIRKREKSEKTRQKRMP